MTFDRARYEAVVEVLFAAGDVPHLAIDGNAEGVFGPAVIRRNPVVVQLARVLDYAVRDDHVEFNAYFGGRLPEWVQVPFASILAISAGPVVQGSFARAMARQRASQASPTRPARHLRVVPPEEEGP